MIDKALIIVIVMYSLGLMIIGFELTIGQQYGIPLLGFVTDNNEFLSDDVTPNPNFGQRIVLNSAIVGFLQESEFNAYTDNITSANFTSNSTFYDRVETGITGGVFVAWELLQLMTGTYIFNILLLFGVPSWLVTLFVTIYILLLARAIVGYVKGI